MGVVAIGLSHRTAPVELREHLAIPPEEVSAALERLVGSGAVSEAVILSTCNRVEVYVRPVGDREAAFARVCDFLETLYHRPELRNVLYRYEAHAAVAHLFRVAAGLDSLVVGEGEILGQVKSAYLLAQRLGKTGKITNVLFQRALFVGKQVRTQTRIAEGASSVGSIAVQLAERIFGSLSNHRILIVGAGKMAEVTARSLLSQKARDITVLNRTPAKAEELAKRLNGASGPLERLPEALAESDIVICSAAAEKPLITTKMVEPIMKARHGRSLYFIDIAVPRNVEPAVHRLDNCYVYNIDDLETIVKEKFGTPSKHDGTGGRIGQPSFARILRMAGGGIG